MAACKALTDQATLPVSLVERAREMITGGLTWLFAAMLATTALLWIVTRMMPARTCSHRVTSDAVDAG